MNENNKIDYDRIVGDIIRIMMSYGATHSDADEVIYRFRKAIKRQRIKAEE